MASTINASTSGSGGIVQTADASGILQLQTGGTTAVTVDASQKVGIGTATATDTLTVNGSGRFYNTYVENSTNIGVYLGYIAATPRIGFFNGTAAQNWQIDNEAGVFRWYTPGIVQMSLTSAGNLQFNSGYGSVATAYGCRAWVNFNGTGTVAIRASGNVSSITDNNVGNYTINFTNAMPNINYSAIGNMNTAGTAVGTANDGQVSPYSYAVGSIAVTTMDGGATLGDKAWISVAIFR